MFGPAVAAKVMEYFAHRPPGPRSSSSPNVSSRYSLLAEGQNNSRISSRLQISDKTVRNHVSNIFTKLAVADRAQAIVRAREAGLGRDATVLKGLGVR